jgi:hypothetical protein
MKDDQHQLAATRETIRIAEKHIKAREFELAMQKLSLAQRMEPDNIYITAIVERIHRIASESSSGGRFLGLTVGNEFEDGVRFANEPVRTPEGIDTQIRRLTSKANELMRQGAYETAFDSLMNAYFLDPVSPTLMESEKTLLPAIEMMRKQKPGRPEGLKLTGLSSFPPSARRIDSSTLSVQDSRRVEELKRRNETERLERERTMWREASRLPGILEEMLEPVPPKDLGDFPQASHEQDEQKESGGFFAKLRHGKFLI